MEDANIEDKEDANVTEKGSNEENKSLNLEELSKEELLEKYKDLQSNSDRWVQKLIKQQKALVEIGKDWKKMLELHKSDPETAKSILKTAFDGMTIEEYQKKLWAWEDKKWWELDIDLLVDKKLEQRQVNEEVTSVIDQLPEKVRSKFKEEFDFIVGNRDLDMNNVHKFLKLTAKAIKEEDSDIAMPTMWNSSGKKAGAVSTEEQKRKEYSRQLLWY